MTGWHRFGRRPACLSGRGLQLRVGARRALLALATALLAGLAGCSDLLVPDPRPSAPVQLFDQVWSDIDRYYAHFDRSGVDWAAVRTNYRPLAQTAPDDRALAEVLARMLATLRDPHVTLYTPFGAYEDTSCYRPGAYDAVAVARYVTGVVALPHMLYGRIGSDVGYVRIPGFGSGDDWSGELDDVLAALGNVGALVVDIRGNGGGMDETANAVAGRFLDREMLAEYVRYRSGPGHEDFGDYFPVSVGPAGRHFAGRVALLTDRRDFSSAEQFVLFMRASGRVTVVGDTTGGASGRPLTRELANGWSYRFSTWISYTPDRQPYEGVGLAPDVVARPASGDAGGTDPALEAALALLR